MPSKCDKILKKAQNSPNNVQFEELSYLAECYGFIYIRQRGSHRQYKRPGRNELMNLQSVHGKAKPNEVKQLLNAIEEILNLDKERERQSMDNYSFTITWSDEDEGYIAVCPEFPGQSAFGESADEALSELKVALGLAIEIYQEESWPLPEPRKLGEYSGQFRIKMPKSLHAKLASQAETEGVSLNTLVVTYLSEAIGLSNAMPKKADGAPPDKLDNKAAPIKAKAS